MNESAKPDKTMKAILERIDLYEKLIRLDRPIGILLLLWPTLWGLWLAARGVADWRILVVFGVGTVLMRSAGCAINDYADRDIDGKVARTAQRPLATGRIAPWEALAIAAIFAACAFALAVLMLKPLAIKLSFVAIFLAATYPFTKRFFVMPQAYLGIAFGFGIPMAFAAITGRVPLVAWLLLLANIFWTIAYDTEYAMVDREDDAKIGIKTSALLFGRHDVTIIMLCYGLMLSLLAVIGFMLHIRAPFYLGLLIATGIAFYHYTLIRTRTAEGCFKAFLHNNWLGATLFLGIALSYPPLSG